MNRLQVMAMVLFSLLAVGGAAAANGITGNLVAGCDCIADACLKACTSDPSSQCCMTPTGETKVKALPAWPGYTASIIGMAGFFTILALNKKEEEMY